MKDNRVFLSGPATGERIGISSSREIEKAQLSFSLSEDDFDQIRMWLLTRGISLDKFGISKVRVTKIDQIMSSHDEYNPNVELLSELRNLVEKWKYEGYKYMYWLGL